MSLTTDLARAAGLLEALAARLEEAGGDNAGHAPSVRALAKRLRHASVSVPPHLHTGGNMEPIVITLSHGKETKGTHVFNQDREPGKPSVVPTLYITKEGAPALTSSARLKITIEVI